MFETKSQLKRVLFQKVSFFYGKLILQAQLQSPNLLFKII